jgi:hypothetical protein
MVTIQTCGSLSDAEVVKSHLEGSGIPAFIPEELSAQNAWGASEGVRVQVNDEDAERAVELLKASPPDPVHEQ